MLPPESTAHTGPVSPSSSGEQVIKAATAATPAGSTMSLARSRHSRSALDSASSLTVTTASTWAATSANGTSPGQPTAIPSAIVDIDAKAVGFPAANDAGQAAAVSACTPTMRTCGRTALTAAATPAINPPPPVGTRIVPTSGSCSRISSPTVPCPATTSSWSNGWTRTAPVRSANSRAATSASSTVEPCRWT